MHQPASALHIPQTDAALFLSSSKMATSWIDAGPLRGDRGQIAPGPEGAKGLITPNVSRFQGFIT